MLVLVKQSINEDERNMNVNAKSALPRGILLSAILILSLTLSGCQLFKAIFGFASAEEEMPMEEQPVMEETTLEPMEEPEPLVVSEDVHVVIEGDSLWAISGMSSIYNDPFRWPLIYARNKDIEDADLIFPGQELAIRRDLSRDEIDAAVAHAKNRGSWEINVVEETDVAYRASTM